MLCILPSALMGMPLIKHEPETHIRGRIKVSTREEHMSLTGVWGKTLHRHLSRLSLPVPSSIHLISSLNIDIDDDKGDPY